MRRTLFALLCAATALPALAEEDNRFFIRGGPAYANFDASAHVAVAGADVPGGDASVSSNTGAAFELGWAWQPNWQLTLALGVPPRARIFGAGSLSGAGKLGELSYAPAVLGVLYVPSPDTPWRPYIGVGVNHTFIYNRRDGALSQLKVDNASGAVLQVGAEWQLSRPWAWFFDIKKIWLKTDASGYVSSPAGSLPAQARVTLDPMIISTGLSFHF
jgi:outer membrane protein